jgi:hypothetical protein
MCRQRPFPHQLLTGAVHGRTFLLDVLPQVEVAGNVLAAELAGDRQVEGVEVPDHGGPETRGHFFMKKNLL